MRFLNTENNKIYSELEMNQEFNKQMELDKQNGNFEVGSFEEWKNCVCDKNGSFEEIIVNAYINATLQNGTNIDGQLFSIVNSDSFFIDDNITGDIFLVDYTEIETINEYIQ